MSPAVGVTVGLTVGRFDGLFWAGPPRSYSDGRRPGDSYWCRHGVMRLDWSADPNQVPEFCAGPVTNSAIGGWAVEMGVCSSAAARRFGYVLQGLGSVPLSSEKGDDL